MTATLPAITLSPAERRLIYAVRGLMGDTCYLHGFTQGDALTHDERLLILALRDLIREATP